MKYLLLKHYRGGPTPVVDLPPMDQWTPEEIDAHCSTCGLRGPLAAGRGVRRRPGAGARGGVRAVRRRGGARR